MEVGRRSSVQNGNVVFVAVGKELRNYRSTLRWVLQNSWDSEIFIIYVHVPSQMFPATSTSGEVLDSRLGEQEELEILGIRDYYVDTIAHITGGNPTGVSHIANSIEEGIVEVVSLYNARRLVMGAATDTGYSREMEEPTSTKAKYVHQHAPAYCQIEFICNGKLISTREAVEIPTPDVEPTTISDVVAINGPDTRAGGSSGNDNLYDQLERAILRTGHSIGRQKIVIEKICQEYLAKELRGLELERNKSIEELDKLRKKLAHKQATPKLFYYFSKSDVMSAINNCDESKKIGEGAYGNIYKGSLVDTQVAIKVPKPESYQGDREFQQEIDALSNLRHPNLVTLIGACLESRALVYGYLDGGNLEDRLNCKGNSPPLDWQTRIKIATELCGVLVFLHSNSPDSIIHGDLKPGNILLDKNNVCKLSDFGICHLISKKEMEHTSFFTAPKGTYYYIDPEFPISGMLSRKSDVYAIGIILLRLLTGKQAIGIANEVNNDLYRNNNNFEIILDPTAGEWPRVHAEELVNMALRCSEMKKIDRPDLVGVWRSLKIIKASSIGLSTQEPVGDDDPPDYFICPIFQETMEDPHFAADGFTYEKKAIQGWLDLGRDSSPMTNMTLQHTNIVPNCALKSAIQEWLQQ